MNIKELLTNDPKGVMKNVEIREKHENEFGIRDDLDYVVVQFPISLKRIQQVKKECEEVTGDNTGQSFEHLVNNALIEYLASDDWERVKQIMTVENNQKY